VFIERHRVESVAGALQRSPRLEPPAAGLQDGPDALGLALEFVRRSRARSSLATCSSSLASRRRGLEMRSAQLCHLYVSAPVPAQSLPSLTCCRRPEELSQRHEPLGQATAACAGPRVGKPSQTWADSWSYAT
jgi:hypothetical protein